MEAPSTAAQPPDELLERVRLGDAQAADALARWCLPRVYRWALMRSGDPDEADDVTQEVIVTLPQRLGSFRGDARFSTWLYRAVVFEAGGRERQRRRRSSILARWWRAEPSVAPVSAERIHDADLVALVRLLLAELPGQQRTVFTLADLQGYSGPEIAEMLDLDEATIRSHLMRARRAIRARMFERLPTLKEDRA